MATVWITFATEDNVDGDVDYLAQEISKAGLRTRQHPLFPGEDDKIDRLMPAFLARPDQCDAWILYASHRTLEDGRGERIGQALQKAHDKRGPFPAVGIFRQSNVAADAGKLPLTYGLPADDPEWRKHLGNALTVDMSARAETGLHSYLAKLLPSAPQPFRYMFEFRPKMGRWNTFLFAILPEERAAVAPEIRPFEFDEGFSDDAEWYFQVGRTPATPSTSYFVVMKEMPSRMAFGQEGTDEVVILNLRATQ
jgi:hypothetical protein